MERRIIAEGRRKLVESLFRVINSIPWSIRGTKELEVFLSRVHHLKVTLAFLRNLHTHNIFGNVFNTLVRILAKFLGVEVNELPCSQGLDNERRVGSTDELDIRKHGAQFFDDLSLPGRMQVELNFIDKNDAVSQQGVVQFGISQSQSTHDIADNRDE